MAKFVTKPNNSISSWVFNVLLLIGGSGLVLFVALLAVFAMILHPLSYMLFLMCSFHISVTVNTSKMTLKIFFSMTH